LRFFLTITACSFCNLCCCRICSSSRDVHSHTSDDDELWFMSLVSDDWWRRLWCSQYQQFYCLRCHLVKGWNYY